MCLDSSLDLWPSGNFELGLFASRIGCSEMECAASSFTYVCSNLEMDNSPMRGDAL